VNGNFANFDRRLAKLENSKLGVPANLADFRPSYSVALAARRIAANIAKLPERESDAMLADGARRAQGLARETMNAVKDVVGFVRS
jgi:tryptophanyl-tRNA synthetase